MTYSYSLADSSVEKYIPTDTWPAITTTDATQYAPVYRTQPVIYQMPSIQIHTPTPMSDEEFIEKLRYSIHKHFGIQDLLPKADKVHIEKLQETPIPLRRGRIIERIE